jgi:hypothetical protein
MRLVAYSWSVWHVHLDAHLCVCAMNVCAMFMSCVCAMPYSCLVCVLYSWRGCHAHDALSLHCALSLAALRACLIFFLF